MGCSETKVLCEPRKGSSSLPEGGQASVCRRAAGASARPFTPSRSPLPLPVSRLSPSGFYLESYINERISGQGVGSFVRISYVLTLCPVVNALTCALMIPSSFLPSLRCCEELFSRWHWGEGEGSGGAPSPPHGARCSRCKFQALSRSASEASPVYKMFPSSVCFRTCFLAESGLDPWRSLGGAMCYGSLPYSKVWHESFAV